MNSKIYPFPAGSMASKSPLKPDFTLPMPPAQIHTRPSDDLDLPTTPTTKTSGSGFTSPSETPQGSPSKKHFPPGAHELPNVFDNALKLQATAGNPNKPHTQLSPTSATKAARSPLTEGSANDLRNSVIQDGQASPVRHQASRLNQENTPPTPGKNPKESPFTTAAAASRHEPYRPRDLAESARSVPRSLPPDALEKLQKPSVKRLANVTQLCELSLALSNTLHAFGTH